MSSEGGGQDARSQASGRTRSRSPSPHRSSTGARGVWYRDRVVLSSRPTAALLLALLAAGTASALTEPSASNLALRGEIRPPARRFSDVWGMGEYLLLGTFQADTLSQHGLYVIDASIPDSLQIVGHLQTDAPPLDVTGVDTLCLLAFEPGLEPPRPAVILASLADPTAPRILGTYRSEADSVTQVHDAWLAPPYAYLACRSTGDLHIIDFSDPLAPAQVGRWSVGTPTRFLHDLIVVDTLAYLAYWQDGLHVLSVADPSNPYEVGLYQYPGAFTHSVALSPDGNIAYVTDEIFAAPYGRLHVLDVSDLSDIREVGTWECPESDASIHNVLVLGDRLYVSYYLCGVRILDISEPAKPVEIAFADVDPPTGGLSGFWGVFPAPGPDTLVYASHMDRGAMVFDYRPFRALTVAADGSAEYATIQAAMNDAEPGDTVRVAPGTYAEGVQMKGRIVLEGAGSTLTTIDPGSAFRGIALSGGGPETVIRRLSVSSGLASDTLGGGGILLVESGALVESVAVIGCEADEVGGGVSIIAGNPTLRALRISGNRAPRGGGLAFRAPVPNYALAPLIVDCAITDNVADSVGGGGFLAGIEPINLLRLTCVRNTALRGGGLALFDSPEIRLQNAIVAWNAAAASGAGIHGEDCFIAVDNSVLADNAAPEGSAISGGGIYGLFADVRDAVAFANHGGSTFTAGASSEIQFDYSDFFGNEGVLVAGVLVPPDPSPARGNLFEDPLFTAPDSARLDYFPSAGSPLIDAGFASPEDADLDGTRQDIGLSGSPGSGWIAPRTAPGLGLGAGGDHEIWVSWSPPPSGGDTWHAIYSSPSEPVPLDAAHRRGRAPVSASFFVDHAASPTDTVFFYRIVPEDSLGHAGSPSGTLSIRPLARPLWLSFPEPNPFRSSTRVRLELDRPSPVAIDVYDAAGRRVRGLFRDHLPAGFATIEWDGKDNDGNALPSGHYFLRETGGGRILARHVVLVR